MLYEIKFIALDYEDAISFMRQPSQVNNGYYRGDVIGQETKDDAENYHPNVCNNNSLKFCNEDNLRSAALNLICWLS